MLRPSLALACVFSLLNTAAIRAESKIDAIRSEMMARQEAGKSLILQAQPDARLESSGERIIGAYGAPMAAGQSSTEAAEQFRTQYTEVFGVPADQLMPGGPVEDGRLSLPLMYNRATGQYKFTLHYYSQQKDGLPVFRSELRVLVRNEPGYPVVMANSTLRNIGDFAVARAAVANVEAGKAAALRDFPTFTTFTEPKSVIWAGVDEALIEPRLALEFIAESDDPFSAQGYDKWLYLTDAATGEVLFKENLVLSETITGTISGMATDKIPPGAWVCRPENLQGLPYAHVSLAGGASPVFANASGNYSLTTPGPGATTVESRLQGQRFVVRDQANGNQVPILSQSVTPPGPGNFTHNAANTDEFTAANVNAYLQANVVRDFVLTYHPTYPTIANQTNFTINTNIAVDCNAFYSGSSINFYRRQGGCNNSAFSDVVHHEYGHHVVQTAGSGQGQYGEGLGDCMGILITDQPVLGYGFQEAANCANGIRNASNLIQYPCSGEIHTCGQLISGCVWETRNLLTLTTPGSYRDIIADLTINSVPLHTGSSIAPTITTQFLTLDDDDANLNNGTPHCFEIATGFGAHNMGVAGYGTTFTYPNGRPDLVPVGTPTTIRVDITGTLCPTPINGSGKVYYRVGNSGPFTALAMNLIGSGQYEAVLPAFGCPATVQYYFATDTTISYELKNPLLAPNQFYTLVVGTSAVTYNFESTPAGWSVSSTATDGQWDPAPGVPVNCSRGDPSVDYDLVGSTKCWLTDNSAASACNSDVDGGSTTLTSEVFDVTALTEPRVCYARWYSNNFGSAPETQTFNVEVSSNGGANWVPLETVGPTSGSPNPEIGGGWYFKSFRIEDFVAKTNQFRIRYIASDLGSGSVVEAGIDAFSIIGCPSCGPADGDMNGDSLANAADVGPFVNGLINSAAFPALCPGDFNSNSNLDLGDVDGFVTALLNAP